MSLKSHLRLPLTASVLLFAVAVGCDDSNTPAPEPPAKPAVEAPKKAPPVVDEAKMAQAEAAVPSPLALAKDLADAGITAEVEKNIGSDVIDMAGNNKDQIAVKTGVALARLVLTAKTAAPDVTVGRINEVKAGLSALGATADGVAALDDLATQVQNGGGDSEGLVQALDDYSRVTVSELTYEGSARYIPLIQAGGWLAGTHVVSGAIGDAGKWEAATKLLKHPEVVDYFVSYLTHEGASEAPDSVMGKLKDTLATLKVAADKETLGQAEVEAIFAATGNVLSQVH